MQEDPGTGCWWWKADRSRQIEVKSQKRKGKSKNQAGIEHSLRTFLLFKYFQPRNFSDLFLVTFIFSFNIVSS